jgi:hypothetical protein
MKNISTGTGIALLAGAIVAYPILDRVMPKADASATHAAAVVAVATAQVEPTIVWYGVADGGTGTGSGLIKLVRAWSDGKVEMLTGGYFWDNGACRIYSQGCGGWQVISSPAQGLTYRSDINFDSKVDGADLGQLLADWGNAPRQDIPPSECPLTLINP